MVGLGLEVGLLSIELDFLPRVGQWIAPLVSVCLVGWLRLLLGHRKQCTFAKRTRENTHTHTHTHTHTPSLLASSLFIKQQLTHVK